MKRILILAALTCSTLMMSSAAQAGTVENLERERAHLIETFLNPTASPAERQGKIETTTRRLVDLERMVLRDDSLKGRNTPAVRKAFANYDLTFLVHASLENNHALLDHWLETVGLSTETVMAARKGRR